MTKSGFFLWVSLAFFGENRLANLFVSVAYAENFHGGGFHSVACGGHLYCAVFVMSQYDVIFMFPNQRFGEVCWHNMHICLHALLLVYSALTHKLSALQVRISEENTLNTTTQQFISAKYQAARWNRGVKHAHHCVRTIYNCKIRLHWCLVEYKR